MTASEIEQKRADAVRPRIERLDHWTLLSTNLERTKRFYKDVLGAVDTEKGPEPTPEQVRLGGTVIDFFVAGDRTPEPGPAGPGGQHHAYMIPLEDYDPWVEYLKAKDVPVYLTTHGLGRISIYINDPDGYHIELTHIFTDLEEGRREIEKRGMTPHFATPRVEKL